MRRKKQFLMVMLCTFSMLANSAAVVAQSKDKKQEPKANTERAPGVPGDVVWIGEQAQEATFHIALADQEKVAYAPARQVEFISHEFNFDGQLVKGMPYSADAVTETIQTLGDGNRIIRNSSSKIYRDSAGRTRREHAMKAVGPWAVAGETPIMISINDPVAGVHYSLNSNTKTGHKMMAPRMVFDSGDANMNAELKAKMKEKIKLRAANGAEAGAVVSGSVTNYATEVANGAVTHAVAGAVAVGGMREGDRVFTWSSDAEVNKEVLGEQIIEGVHAEGTRVTFTIPAGKIGNERPIVTVNERWFSPELKTIVLSKNSDPRMGETTYRLTNIVRGEPDPSLFHVPSDYTVKEGGAFNFRTGSPVPPTRFEMERRAKKPDDN
jgi:hypothetical protein